MFKTLARTLILFTLMALLTTCGSTGTPEPVTTAVPATPTRVAQGATRTPLPPTRTPLPPAPTETSTPSPTSTRTPVPAPTPVEPLAVTLYPELGTRVDARTYGGEYNDYLYDILRLEDGGLLLAGQAENTGFSHRITPGTARLIRTDAEGTILWQKDYGGEIDGDLYSLVQVGDDEFVALGTMAASYLRDETDFYLVKIDGQGNEIWSHTYGGRGMDGAKMVRQTTDGGFVMVGSRADEFPTGDQYEADIVLIKTDPEGNEVWTRTYGDRTLYLGWGVAQTPDGGYVLIGWEAKTYSDRDVMAIKTDAEGKVEWSRVWDLDPGDRDEGNDLILTADGHVVIACIRSEDTGQRGAVLIKVDLEGNEIWTKQYGEEGVGYEFWDIMEDWDGGYVMAGSTLPGERTASGEDIRHGWVIKTDRDGEVLWEHVFDITGCQQEMFSAAVVLPEGGYVFVGRATLDGARFADMLLLELTTSDEAINLDGWEVKPLTATYGGRQHDRAFDVLVTGDGGTLVAGLADSAGLSHRIVPGKAWLIRTDGSGDVLWEKSYGGEVDAQFMSIIQAGEDEYVLLGDIAASYERDETDVYLVKVDGDGHEIWSRTFGGRGMDLGMTVQQTADGGYILVGDQADEFPTGMAYNSKILLIKTDAEGNLVWSRTYGTEFLYLGWGVTQAPDGGYVLAGWEAKTIDERDVVLIKTDAAGEVEWSKTWNLGERDGAFDMVLTSDGFVVLACIQDMGSGGPSAVLIKVDLEGDEVWSKVIGEQGIGNTFWGMVEDADGGYVMAGDTHLGKMPRSGGDIHGAWMVKTDADGEIVWQHVFGGGYYQQAGFRSVALLPGGGYVFVGEVTGYSGSYSDIVWVRLED